MKDDTEETSGNPITEDTWKIDVNHPLALHNTIIKAIFELESSKINIKNN